MTRRRSTSFALAAAAALMLVTACGGDGDSSSDASESPLPGAYTQADIDAVTEIAYTSAAAQREELDRFARTDAQFDALTSTVAEQIPGAVAEAPEGAGWSVTALRGDYNEVALSECAEDLTVRVVVPRDGKAVAVSVTDDAKSRVFAFDPAQAGREPFDEKAVLSSFSPCSTESTESGATEKASESGTF